ncbi:hypothetical protein V8G54_010234 [Vigna mungo]|uniref:Trichome birefringence-like C-terminal domain-containing protein n=1 Tax=Vigna mungo TaxID=3915 RepID=A0AAQ3S4P0_VIGMU
MFSSPCCCMAAILLCIVSLFSSPCALRSREWKPESEGNCYGEKDPIYNEGYWGSGSDLPTMSTVEKILSNLSSKVSVINITQLSEYRKDGHPSIFRKFWEPLRPEQLSNPSSYSDCIHWCLPGGRLLLTSKCRKFRGLINDDVHLKEHKTKVVICFDFF